MSMISFVQDAGVPFTQAYAAKPVPGTAAKPDLAALKGCLCISNG